MSAVESKAPAVCMGCSSAFVFLNIKRPPYRLLGDTASAVLQE
jgi:hypothetical protein